MACCTAWQGVRNGRASFRYAGSAWKLWQDHAGMQHDATLHFVMPEQALEALMRAGGHAESPARFLPRSGLIAALKAVLGTPHMAAMRAWTSASHTAGSPSGASLAGAAVSILHAPFLPPTHDEVLQHELQDVRT